MRAYPKIGRGTTLLVVLAALGLAPAAQAAGPRGFAYGVAAGEVTRSSAILWTRADELGPLRLQVATDHWFYRRLPERVANSGLTHDHTVNVRVTGLTPDTVYYYRFRIGSTFSPLGTFRTAPPLGADRRIRFAFAGDTDAQRARGQSRIYYDGLAGNNGLTAEAFGAYRRMALENNTFNINFGDTIYSDTEVPGFPAATTQAAKRVKYRQNLAVKALQSLRRFGGVYSHWDDHEFINDFSKAENGAAIYNAGVNVFREYNPVHYTSQTGLYNHQRWGKNLEIFRLDERSFRSAKASANHTCDNPQTHQPDLAPTAPQSTRTFFSVLVPSFSQPVSQACKDRINDPKRTFLGKAQLNRFISDVTKSTATFKVVMNETPIQQFYALPYDRWEGYAYERGVLLHALQNAGVKNLVFLATDTHATLVNVVRYRTLESGGPVNSPYSEVVAGPVSTMTFRREIDKVTGTPGSGNAIDSAFFGPQPPNGMGMPCSNVDAYSYGHVDVQSGRMSIEARDVHGQLLSDQSQAGTGCFLDLTKK
jgi:phosphodiesterase/alkaline phosphatase D-like protein